METKEKQWLIAGTKYKLSIWNEEVPIKTISRFEFKASLDGKCGWQFQSDEPSEFAVWLSLIASMGVLLNSTECPIQQVWRLSIYHLLWFLWTLILSSLLFISSSSHMSIICTTYNCAFMSLFKLLMDRTDSHNNHRILILYIFMMLKHSKSIFIYMISFVTIIMGGRKGNLFYSHVMDEEIWC